MAEHEVEEAAKAVELVTGCGIDIDTAREEANWYSILNVISLSLGSGMGIPLDESETNELLGNAGLCMPELPLQNPAFLKAFFKSGDPHLIKQFDTKNLDTWRWSPDSFDRMLTPQSQGWTIIAETECAKWFGIAQESKVPSEDLRKEWMSNNLLFCSLARKQCDFAFDNLRNNQGLFMLASKPGSVKVTESICNLEDQTCMLWACSDIASLAGKPGSMCADMDIRQKYLSMADCLFQAIVNNKDSLLNTSSNKILAQAVAVPALAWYACITKSQDLKARSLWLLREFSDNLVKAQENSEMVGNTIVDAAASMRALTEAFRITKLRTYAETASKIFDTIESQWDVVSGVYAQTHQSREFTYNADNIGIITGALNAARMFLKDRINQGLAELRMRVFFCNAVHMSGLQMSMPSPDFLPQWLQQREPEMHFRHNSVPLPSQAGGDSGIAPVFAGEVSYDPQSDTWSRRLIFDTPSAMHACCELLWLNPDLINGFPELSMEEAPLAVRQAVGIDVGI